MEGTSTSTREKPVSLGMTSCVQGSTLGFSASPSDARFSQVSLRCILPRRLLAHTLPCAVRMVAGSLLSIFTTVQFSKMVPPRRFQRGGFAQRQIE